MKNIFIVIFIISIFFIHSRPLFSSNSSSYLVSQSAFYEYDFSTVLYEFNLNKNKIEKSSYLDELISSIITDNMVLANEIANKILLSDGINQEAKLLNFVYNLINNNNQKIFDNRLDTKGAKNDLFEFLFFNENQLKSKNEISNSFIDIVKSSYADNDIEYSLNYNFLLFYTSLAIAVNPQNQEALFLKAQLYQIIEKYYQAEVFYKKIINKSPYYIDAQRNLAFNYSKFLNYNEAEKKIKTVLKNNKENYYIKKILADFYRTKDKYNLAIEIYNDLINDNKDDIWHIYYLRGICYERLNKWSIAEKNFLTSLDIKPNSPNVLNYLAYGWLEKDMNINQSYEMLKKAYKGNPNSFYILDSLAWAHFKKNNLNEAANLMEQVIDIAPGEAISLDHLGDIYFAMNRKREAKHFWKQAKDLAEPEDGISEKIEIKLSNLNAG